MWGVCLAVWIRASSVNFYLVFRNLRHAAGPPMLCLVRLHYLLPNLIWPPETRPRASSPLSGSYSLCPWPDPASLVPTLAVLLFCNGHLPFRVHLWLALWSNSLFTQARPPCPFPIRLIFPLYLARLCGSKSETSLSLQAWTLIGYWMGGDKLGWDTTLCYSHRVKPNCQKHVPNLCKERERSLF